jgi:hypothetical protein
MQKLELSGVFPNITIALHIFVSLHASVASDEHTLNVLEQDKNYYCSSMDKTEFEWTHYAQYQL